ncbi:MAG: hypothetical protein MUC84_04905 [Solirubrobacteraceae bacterium]|nr:hypothetical protein [Solirubrobacteraceae bacterium]
MLAHQRGDAPVDGRRDVLLEVQAREHRHPLLGQRQALDEKRALDPRDRVDDRPRRCGRRGRRRRGPRLGLGRRDAPPRLGRPARRLREPLDQLRPAHAQAAGRQLDQLVAHRARRQRTEHGLQRLDDRVLALGLAQVPALELALDPEAHERHRRRGPLAQAVGALRGEQVRGVLPGGQRHDAQLQPAARGDARGLEHRLLAGAVGVEREQDHRREPRQLGHLVVGERGAHQADGVHEARLVHRDHVGVALAEQHLPRLRRRRARQVGAEQVAALVVDGVVGRVDVLRLLVGADGAPAEPEHAPARVAERELEPPAEEVVEVAVASAAREPRVEELLLGVAGAPRVHEHRVPRARRVADPEGAQRLLLEAAPEQVRPRLGGLLGLPEHPHVPRRGPLEQLEQPLAALAPARGVRVLVDDLERHAVAVGEVLHRLAERQPLGQLDELEEVAALAAAEAVEDLLLGVDAERRRALVVERAGAHPLVPGAAQLGLRAHEVEHVGRVADALDRLGGVAGHRGRPYAANDSGTVSSSNTRMQ